MDISDDPSTSAAAAKETFVDPPKQAQASDVSAGGPSRVGTSLPARFVVWSLAAIAFAAACAFGWWVPHVRPEPFDDPPRPLSLAWWVTAPADPGIADLDMVPVGAFGGYLPRAVARQIPFDLTQIADQHLQPDGKEIVISLRGSANPATAFRYSNDGGLSWAPRDDPDLGRCDASQLIKIHGFLPGGQTIRAACFPTRQIPRGDQLQTPQKGEDKAAVQQNAPVAKSGVREFMIGDATTAIMLGDSAAFSAGFSFAGSPEGIWLRAIAPYVVFTDRSAAYVLTVPNTQRPQILLPRPGNQVAVASTDGFVTVTIPAGLNRDTPSNPLTGPLAEIRRETGPPLPVSRLTTIRDPAHPEGNPSIRALRLSHDGKTIVVAQDVAPDAAVLVSHDAGQKWSRLAYVSGSAPWVVFIALPLAFFSAAAAARQLIRTPAGQPSIADEAATDRPIGLGDIDALQFEPIARGLLMFIRNPRTEPPVTIAVTGQWGSGKTSLMSILRDLLREYDARPVWFNAWHHQKEEHLLAALIENIRQQAIPPVGTWSGLFFRLRLLRGRLLGRLGVLIFLLAAVLIFSSLYLSLPVTTTKQWQASLLEFYKTTVERKPPAQAAKETAEVQDARRETKAGDDWLVSLVTLLPTSLAIPVLILGIIRNLQPFPRAKPEQLLGGKKDKVDIASKLSFRYRFEREFRQTTAALRNSASPGLVIFVDDLDRCHAQNVVELLEAINFIVTAGECFVILGMAKDQIRRSILANYKSEFIDIPKEAVRGGDVAAARRRFADRYLEKLINIEVPVPQASPEQIRSLLTGEAKRPPPAPGVAARHRLRFVYDNGPAILAVAFLVSLCVWLRPHLEIMRAQPVAPTAGTTAAPPASDAPPQAGSGATAGLTIPQVYAADQDLPTVQSRAGFPWAQSLLVLALLAAAGTYLARLWVLAKQRPASDSPAFRTALELWSGVIFLALRTPRAVKQYKNRLRYQAMRLRSLKAEGDPASSIPEADLVALGAITLASPSLLTDGSGKPIRTVLADKHPSTPEESALLQQIATSLEKHSQRQDSPPPMGLELWTARYMELLAPQS